MPVPLLKAISATVYCETYVPPPEVLNATVHLQFEPCPYLVMAQVTKPVAATELVMLYAIFFIFVSQSRLWTLGSCSSWFVFLWFHGSGCPFVWTFRNILPPRWSFGWGLNPDVTAVSDLPLHGTAVQAVVLCGLVVPTFPQVVLWTRRCLMMVVHCQIYHLVVCSLRLFI